VNNLAGHLVKYGKHRERRSYSRIKEVLDLPNLIEIQTDSYKWFLDEGLREMFEDIMPIEDFAGNLSLEFVDYQLLEPKSMKHVSTTLTTQHHYTLLCV
jgi:DNA-directed RNA polymerase subunit beta